MNYIILYNGTEYGRVNEEHINTVIDEIEFQVPEIEVEEPRDGCINIFGPKLKKLRHY